MSFFQRHRLGYGVFLVGSDVGDVDDLSLRCNPSGHAPTPNGQNATSNERVVFARKGKSCYHPISFSLEAGDKRGIGFAQPYGRFDQRIEHRLQVKGRPADYLEHFRGRRLLLQGLPQFCGPLLDLVFQVGIRFLQPRAHFVELVSEAFQFVAGLDRDALAEIAGADACGARAQRLDRADHASRQQDPRKHSKH